MLPSRARNLPVVETHAWNGKWYQIVCMIDRKMFQACLTPAGMLGALDLGVIVLGVGRHPDCEGGGAV